MKTWCKHIRWIAGTYSGAKWRIKLNSDGVISHRLQGTVPRSWKLCPICEKRKPTQVTKFQYEVGHNMMRKASK